MGMKAEIVEKKDTLELVSGGKFPSLIQLAGKKATYKFVEFFRATLSNDNTREAYARAVYRFFAWCEGRGLELSTIPPVATAGYIRELERSQDLSATSIKQHLSAIKRLFDFFVVEGVTSYNPASSVRGPKYSAKQGKTPVLTAEETRQLFSSIETMENKSIKDYRDLALLGVLFYSWVRVGAACRMNVGDYYVQSKGRSLRFLEKGSKLHIVPAHHKVVEYLDAYLSEAGVDSSLKSEKNKPLFRTLDRSRQLTTQRLDRENVFRMVRQRAIEAGINTEISVHTARATGITTYLENGGRVEQAQEIANHADPRTTKLYDRRKDIITQAEIERVQYREGLEVRES
jgi:integrase/recombinase XerD